MGEKKFKAFISYAHADEEWGAWLQRSLERYRPPPELARRGGAASAARLAPVFRDREDLPVAGNLSDAIRSALADSEFQIVLCSPSAARSRWVNDEIRHFQKLNGPGRTFALIIAGEPGASFIPRREDEECFPPALRFELDADRNLTNVPAEPLAADARKTGDGKRYAFLKIAAGMLGVGLDDLIRRDAQRRTRIATATAIASTAGAAVLAFAAVAAFTARNEARAMRAEAEGLIEFMLGDLRDKLEPVGKLAILEAVADRATAYYEGQNPKSLDDAALARRAQAMIQLGAIDFARNDLDAAQRAFEDAEARTAALLKKAPNDPERVFNYAQSVFYLGQNSLALGDIAEGERRYRDYLRLAEQLVKTDGTNPKWRLELAYATSNLGSVKYYAGDYDAAIAYFSDSIEARRALMEAAPGDRKIASDYAYALSWRAFAELARGSYATAIDLIREQLGVYGADAAMTSEDYKTLDVVVTAHRRLAEANLGLGAVDEARKANNDARAIVEKLVRREPDNANWAVNASHIYRTQCYLASLAGDKAASAAAARQADASAKAACRHRPCEEWMIYARALALGARLSSPIDDADAASAAADLEKLMPDLRKSATIDGAATFAAASLALARHKRRFAGAEDSIELSRDAAAVVAPKADLLPAMARIRLAALHLESGEPAKASRIISDLEARGVAHPELAAMKRRLGAPDWTAGR
ncbi:MAG: TIR domain-containing protein [Parvularculaceae bacterium]|nr:TIR domain-containing protein [Parvularculaceae bacterium]